MKNKSLISLALSALIAFGTGCSLLPNEEELLPVKLASASPVVYSTVKAEIGSIESSISGIGNFKSYGTRSLSFSSDGVLYKIYTAKNKTVKKGDLLAELKESSDIKIQIAAKNREINNLENTKEQAYNEFNGIGSTALLALALEKEEYELQAILKTGAAEDSPDVKTQKLKVLIAKTEYETALKKAESAYLLAESDYDFAVEELEVLKKKYDGCFIRAPFTGYCTWVDPLMAGSKVQAGENLITLAEAGSIVLAFSSPSNISEYVKVGTKMEVAIGENIYTGSVLQTPETQPADVIYGVPFMYLLTLDDLDIQTPNLLGVSASVKYTIASHKDVIVMDYYLLETVNDKYYVSILVDGLPQKKEVTLGLRSGGKIEITSGLSEGDEIIVG